MRLLDVTQIDREERANEEQHQADDPHDVSAPRGGEQQDDGRCQSDVGEGDPAEVAPLGIERSRAAAADRAGRNAVGVLEIRQIARNANRNCERGELEIGKEPSVEDHAHRVPTAGGFACDGGDSAHCRSHAEA